MLSLLPREILDQICEHLYHDLWLPISGTPHFKPINRYDIRGPRPIGSWLSAWRALTALRLSSKPCSAAAARVYFRQLRIPLWEPSRRVLHSLLAISRSEYAVHVEGLGFVQWPDAGADEQGDGARDPELRAFSEENRELLVAACGRFTRLARLEMDHSAYYTTDHEGLERTEGFWEAVFAACPGSLSRLSYHWPGTKRIFMGPQDPLDESVDEGDLNLIDAETPAVSRQMRTEQVKSLDLTVGQYCISVVTPKFRLPTTFGTRGLEVLRITYLWWLPTFWLPIQLFNVTTLRGFVLAMEQGNYIDAKASDLQRLLLANKATLQWLKLECIVVREGTWADVLGGLLESNTIVDVELRKLMFTRDRGARFEVVHGAVTFQPRGWGADGEELSDDLRVVEVLLDRAEKNAAAVTEAGNLS